jgi:hypothetical protein
MVFLHPLRRGGRRALGYLACDLATPQMYQQTFENTPMMPSDAQLATLACVDIYSPTAVTDSWDHIDVGMDNGVFWGLKKLPGYDVVVFRGSVTRLDWDRDFRALAQQTRIGHVHSGFWAGMEKMWAECRPLLTQPIIVCGHSLGAARAAILTGLMVADGAPPIARVVFGEPKPGLLDFARLIKDVPGRSYRNGDSIDHDLVTDVPLSRPPSQFVHPTPIIPVTDRPSLAQFVEDAMFAWHHGPLYNAALQTLTQEKAS